MERVLRHILGEGTQSPLKMESDLYFREEPTPWIRINVSTTSQGFNKQVLSQCIFEAKILVVGTLELIVL